jgi:hypothetical protein
MRDSARVHIAYARTAKGENSLNVKHKGRTKCAQMLELFKRKAQEGSTRCVPEPKSLKR